MTYITLEGKTDEQQSVQKNWSCKVKNIVVQKRGYMSKCYDTIIAIVIDSFNSPLFPQDKCQSASTQG